MFHSNSDSTSKKAYNEGRQSGIDDVISRLHDLVNEGCWSESEMIGLRTVVEVLCAEFPAESSENESE